MKKILFLICFSIASLSYSQEKSEQYLRAENISEQLAGFIQGGDFQSLNELFSESLKENLAVKKIETLFSQLTEQHGSIIDVMEFSEKKTAEQNYYNKGLAFEKEKYNLVFSLNEEGKMSSFRIAPYTPVYHWKVPVYAKEESLNRKKVTIGEENPLNAEFVSPKVSPSKIVIVMVHGSGPNDMDESLGPNKMFKDLAYGLSSNGLASLRYNKRSYDYASSLQAKINELTIDDIVTNDAVLAVKKAKELGAEKVILLGHSLGGHLAPKIAAKVDVDGVIIMAGNSSPLAGLIVPQYEHIMANDPNSGITDFQLNMIKAQVKNLNEENYTDETTGPSLPFGLPGKYWRSLQEYKPIKLAKKQAQPYLILNGERDYQVTPKEANSWKNGNKNKKSKTIIYPKLNHMFYSGEGVLIPSEYEEEGHLEIQVLIDIINWCEAL